MSALRDSASWLHHWDFIFLVYCCRFRRAPVISALFGLSNVQLKLFHPCVIFFIQKDPSPSFYCLRNNPGGSYWVYLRHSERCHTDVEILPKPCPFPSSTSAGYLYLVVSRYINLTGCFGSSYVVVYFQTEKWTVDLNKTWSAKQSVPLMVLVSWRCHFGLPALPFQNLKGANV